MLSRRNSKREKEPPADLDWHIRDLRAQLSEQIAIVDCKCEYECSTLRELNEFFRKRAEIETSYSRSLEKLARSFASRQRSSVSSSSVLGCSSIGGSTSQLNSSTAPIAASASTGADAGNTEETAETPIKPGSSNSRRIAASSLTTYNFLVESVASARQTAADHSALGELFERALASRCVELAESVQRSAKHWRVAINEAYEHTVRCVSELQQALRGYQAAFAEYSAAGVKLTDMHARGDRIATQLSLRLAKRKHSEPFTTVTAGDLAANASGNAAASGGFMQRAICGTSNLPAEGEGEEQYAYAATTETDQDQPAALLNDVMLKQVGTSMQKKVKAYERELGKKQSKCSELRLRAVRARNEYALSLESCNAQLVRLQHDYVAELIDGLHVGYHGTLRRLTQLHASAERGLACAAMRRTDSLRRCASRIDARADQRCVLRQPAFTRTRQFHFQPVREDDLPTTCLLFASSLPVQSQSQSRDGRKSLQAEENDVETPIEADMVQRAVTLKRRVEELRTDAEEECTTVEASERSFLESLALPKSGEEEDNEPALTRRCSVITTNTMQLGGNAGAGAALSLTNLSGVWTAALCDSRKSRSLRTDNEQVFFDRLRSYLLKSCAVCCAQARFAFVQRSLREKYPFCAKLSQQLDVSNEQLASFCFTNEQLAAFGDKMVVALLLRCADKRVRARVSTNQTDLPVSCVNTSFSNEPVPVGGRPRVFATSLADYVAATKEPVPTIVSSCVRVLAEQGIQQQGLFRVSGAQTEIAELRALFDRGADPLAHVNTRSSQGVNVHSVACLLKAYFRELGERGTPLFATDLFDDLVACVDGDRSTCVSRLAGITTKLQSAAFVTCRFLFAFLAHVAQHATANMMDTYNLAICFAPTLLPVPQDRDPVRLQAHAIDVVQTCIEHHETLFPAHVPGPIYKYSSSKIKHAATQTVADALYEVPVAPLRPQAPADEPDSEDSGDETEAEAEWFEARAEYDYEARSEQECSLRKNDLVRVSKRVSEDWYEGSSQSRTGLIPAAYIVITRRLSETPAAVIDSRAKQKPSANSRSHTSVSALSNDVVTARASPKRDGAPPRFEAQLSLDETAIAARRALADRTELCSSEVPIARDSADGPASSNVTASQNVRQSSSSSKPSLASSRSCSKPSLTSTSDSCSKPSLSQSDSSKSTASQRRQSNPKVSTLPLRHSPMQRKASEPAPAPYPAPSEDVASAASASASQQSIDETLLLTLANPNDVSATRGTELSISFDEIQDDIDAALAEVMSGLESLERQQREKIERDLTALTADGDPAPPISVQVQFGGARSSLAEMFATTDQSTLRRNSPNANANAPIQVQIPIPIPGQLPFDQTSPQGRSAAPASPKTPPVILPKPKAISATMTTSVIAQPTSFPVPANGGRAHEHHAGVITKSRSKNARDADSSRRKTTALTMPLSAHTKSSQRD